MYAVPTQQCCMRRYGFETNTNMVHGLYGPDAVVEDFLTVMYRIKALGFNAIRTPISFPVRDEARSSYRGSRPQWTRTL